MDSTLLREAYRVKDGNSNSDGRFALDGKSGVQPEYLASRAIMAGKLASKLIMSAFESQTQKIIMSDRHDLKLDIDAMAEEIIIAALKKDFPGHSFLSEEKGFVPGKEPYVWVIDPLDGSVNYYFGIGAFAISIACYSAHKTATDGLTEADVLASGVCLAGLVLLPGTGDCFTAIHGRGAFFNGQPLEIPQRTLGRSVVSMNFSGRGRNMDGMQDLLGDIVGRAMKVRSLGVTAVELCWVAQGRLGAVIQRGVRLWDFAAGRGMVEESGGIFISTPNPSKGWDIVAACPGIFEEIGELCGKLWT